MKDLSWTWSALNYVHECASISFDYAQSFQKLCMYKTVTGRLTSCLRGLIPLAMRSMTGTHKNVGAVNNADNSYNSMYYNN